MPGPKPGNPVTNINATKPEAVHLADSADPGEVNKLKAQQQTQQSGKYGQTKAKAFKPLPIAVSSKDKQGQEQQAKTSWVGIELVDEAGQPLAGYPYTITLPDGSVKTGTTDAKGRARVEQFAPGNCTLTLEQLDEKSW